MSKHVIKYFILNPIPFTCECVASSHMILTCERVASPSSPVPAAKGHTMPHEAGASGPNP